MSEPKFTKGPLTIREISNGYLIDDDEGFAIADVYGHDENGKANARLYAAAPDLYKALKSALTAIDAFWPEDAPENKGQSNEDKAISKVRKDAREAIAKLEKES
jgi:hypothetical protein